MLKLALVTVTSKDYLRGTYSLFKSFLHNNSWYTGDFICIDVDLDERDKRYLSKFSPLFEKPSEAFVEKYQLLQKASIKNLSRLYDIEAFRLVCKYDKLLYLDSDIIVDKPVSELFNLSYHAACVDSCILKGQRRAVADYVPISKNRCANEPCYEHTINTGMMLLQHDAHEVYHKVLDLMIVSTLAKVKDIVVDEPVINLALPNFFSIVPSTYNYRIHLEMEHNLYENIKYAEAKVFHYTGKNKPWFIKSIFTLVIRNWGYVKYLRKWFKYS